MKATICSNNLKYAIFSEIITLDIGVGAYYYISYIRPRYGISIILGSVGFIKTIKTISLQGAPDIGLKTKII